MNTPISKVAKSIRYVIAASVTAGAISVAPVIAQEQEAQQIEKNCCCRLACRAKICC